MLRRLLDPGERRNRLCGHVAFWRGYHWSVIGDRHSSIFCRWCHKWRGCQLPLQRSMQGLCKLLDRRETSFWRFCQCLEQKLLDLLRHFGTQFTHRRWCIYTMLYQHLQWSPLEGTLTREPLINRDGKGILVAGRTWFALALLRSHISRCAKLSTKTSAGRALFHHPGDTKIAELYVPIAAYQHVLRFDIAMN